MLSETLFGYFVSNQFLPEQVNLIRKDDAKSLSTTSVDKTYQIEFIIHNNKVLNQKIIKEISIIETEQFLYKTIIHLFKKY